MASNVGRNRLAARATLSPRGRRGSFGVSWSHGAGGHGKEWDDGSKSESQSRCAALNVGGIWPRTNVEVSPKMPPRMADVCCTAGDIAVVERRGGACIRRGVQIRCSSLQVSAAQCRRAAR